MYNESDLRGCSGIALGCLGTILIAVFALAFYLGRLYGIHK